MSCRYPHYVYYYPVAEPLVFVANAEDAGEAIRDFRNECGERMIIQRVTTTPPSDDDNE